MPDKMIEQNTTLVDLKFLESPLTKLAETVKDFANLYMEPKKALKMAKAEIEVDKLKALAQIDLEETVKQQIAQRIIFKELRRKENIDEIVEKSKTFLPESVNNEQVDQDWVFNFFESCQDVGNEQMQILWAKILAGEIAQPKAFSARTIAFVKTMSKKDADLISKLCNYAWHVEKDSSDYCFLIYPEGIKSYLANKELNYANFAYLENIGVLQSIAGITLENNQNLVFRLNYDNDSFVFLPKAEKAVFPVYRLSNIGGELARLRDFKRDDEYLSGIINSMAALDIEVKEIATDNS